MSYLACWFLCPFLALHVCVAFPSFTLLPSFCGHDRPTMPCFSWMFSPHPRLRGRTGTLLLEVLRAVVLRPSGWQELRTSYRLAIFCDEEYCTSRAPKRKTTGCYSFESE